jgi:NADPH:quinone reductase-like Zn-dependent oxidoreductase
MRAAYAVKMGGEHPLDNLEVGERPHPEPGPGEALVRVQSVSLNHHDLWTLRGVVGAPVQLPRILGCEAAGVVEAYGPDRPAGTPDPGTEVVLYPVITCGRCAACLGPDATLCREFGMLSDAVDGTLAEYVVLPAVNVLSKPQFLSTDEAACLATTFLTGSRMLFTRGRLRPGHSVLIPGAGGGVATALIQMAKAAGLTVFVTSRDATKREAALQLGADHALETGGGVARAVLDLTGGRGVDAVMETVGEPTWAQSLRATRPGGAIVVSGATGGANPPADLARVFWRQLAVVGSTMGTREEMLAVLRFMEAARIHPLIDQVFPFDRVRDAFVRLEAGRHTGKIVVRV